jgi:selenide,water dikinase
VSRDVDDPRVLVGPQAGDDAGVFLFASRGLVATADFITPVCDDPLRFGRIAAANSLSDVWAMGGRPLFALNLCCFPEQVPADMLGAILEGAAECVRRAGGVILGGHTVRDEQLKFGLAVIGEADPGRLLTHRGARPGERLVLTKPIGTGVLINAYKQGKLDEEGLEPALVEMERLNDSASRLALEHGSASATDITGFGLAGHALAIARSSGVGLRFDVDAIPLHPRFAELVERGVTTGSTSDNRQYVLPALEGLDALEPPRAELLFDPQTSGGLLVSLPAARAEACLADLLRTGHRAAIVGEVLAGPPRLIVTSTLR